MNVLLLDCDDSYTYNIYDYTRRCGVHVEVIHFTDIHIDQIALFNSIILPPGPKAPQDIPILSTIIDLYHRTKPILGICLGHQAIGNYFGHAIAKSKHPSHGISVKLHLDKKENIFSNIDRHHFYAMRYNSLTVLDKEQSPLQVICRDEHDEIMGFKHRIYPVYSFQFHPESIGTPNGIQLFQNFFNQIQTT